jgi:hypothetical protein
MEPRLAALLKADRKVKLVMMEFPILSVGLDMARLKKDMQSPQISDRIIANYNLARGIRVVQTPAVIVGGPAGVHIMGSESAAIDFPKAVAAARRK